MSNEFRGYELLLLKRLQSDPKLWHSLCTDFLKDILFSTSSAISTTGLVSNFKISQLNSINFIIQVKFTRN